MHSEYCLIKIDPGYIKNLNQERIRIKFIYSNCNGQYRNHSPSFWKELINFTIAKADQSLQSGSSILITILYP